MKCYVKLKMGNIHFPNSEANVMLRLVKDKVGFCIFVFLWHFTCGHPQCTDSRPPFSVADNSDSPLFCSEYGEFGCCNVDLHSSIQNRTERILQEVKDEVSTECNRYVRSLLCQQCSPYAAHIYDSELTGLIRPFPGLCRSYCLTFYNKCSKLIKYLTNDEQLWRLANLMDGDQFCSKIAITDNDYCFPELLTNDVLNREISKPQRSREGCLCLEEFASNLSNPLRLIHAPGDYERVFIAEQTGVVHIYFTNGTKQPEHFLDLSNRVLTSSYKGDERGFLGMAFHPNFTVNHIFYVYYSIYRLRKQRIRISEFKVYENNSDQVDYGTEKVILEVIQPYWNHNGGEILFGDDGFLYLFIGDGGYKGDPMNYSQNKSVLLGKALRLDVNVNTSSGRPYKIPLDNPFINEVNARPEIYAYGIRNIWRCDVDEGDPLTGYGKGRILCGDVGQDAYEEIDLLEKGGNYGWRAYEGFSCYDSSLCGKIGPVVEPIQAYGHSVGKSVIGGHIYRGCLNPNLNGMYIYGDFMSGRLFRLKENVKTRKWENTELFMCGSEICFNCLVGVYETSILSFGEDANGEIYMLTTSNPTPTKKIGKVYKFIDPRRRGDPSTCRSGRHAQSQTCTGDSKTTTPIGSTEIPLSGVGTTSASDRSSVGNTIPKSDSDSVSAVVNSSSSVDSIRTPVPLVNSSTSFDGGSVTPVTDINSLSGGGRTKPSHDVSAGGRLTYSILVLYVLVTITAKPVLSLVQKWK